VRRLAASGKRGGCSKRGGCRGQAGCFVAQVGHDGRGARTCVTAALDAQKSRSAPRSPPAIDASNASLWWTRAFSVTTWLTVSDAASTARTWGEGGIEEMRTQVGGRA
jgi:hypothetical protein